jgi:lysozyme
MPMATPKPASKRLVIATAIAVALATPAEGLRRVAYYDPPGFLTVCRGHTGADVLKNKVYNLKECDAFMDNDMRAAVSTVERCVPGLPENVLAAFADAVYNMGPTIACDRQKSTAARYLWQGKLLDGCNQLPRWDKARVAGVMVVLPGLAKRRELERQVCLKGLA